MIGRPAGVLYAAPMKIARFSTGDEFRYGIVEGLPADDPAPSGESEGHLIVLRGDPLYTLPEATGEVVPLLEARLVSPVIPRSKVVGISGSCTAPASQPGAEPTVFLKPNTAVVGPDSPIVLPHWSHEVHYEAELAVVIKSVAKDLAPRDVPRVVLGYTVANDVSARDVSAATIPGRAPRPSTPPARSARGSRFPGPRPASTRMTRWCASAWTVISSRGARRAT